MPIAPEKTLSIQSVKFDLIGTGVGGGTMLFPLMTGTNRRVAGGSLDVDVGVGSNVGVIVCEGICVGIDDGRGKEDWEGPTGSLEGDGCGGGVEGEVITVDIGLLGDWVNCIDAAGDGDDCDDEDGNDDG